MIVSVIVKNHNLNSGNVCLKQKHIQAFWNGDIDRLWVCNENGQMIESYHGEVLRRLIMSARPQYNDNGDVIYYLAARFLLGDR